MHLGGPFRHSIQRSRPSGALSVWIQKLYADAVKTDRLLDEREAERRECEGWARHATRGDIDKRVSDETIVERE